MTRAVIYARYSSDLQREASIEDQVRQCRARLDAEGWQLAATYTDHAMSGASRLRPGYQKLLEDARAGAFDVVVAEALDRLSRDQEYVAALYKQLTFAGIRLVTLAEGEINELHVGLKGAMNALLLKDVAMKVRRGLEGRVRQGRSGGGLSFGYEVVKETDASGEPMRGGRRIVEHESEIVRRIFAEFALGRSPRAIARDLNRQGVPGLRGTAWGPSTIYGNWRRGTGILNNELYAGRLVWNRQRFVKDPVSGKRQARPNPEKAWVVEEVPELRIVADDLWQRVKHRQQERRDAVVAEDAGVRPERARRPSYLLSGLLSCGACGGGFAKISTHHYGCSNARNRGTCDNLLTIRRDVVEASVLEGLKRHLMHPDLVREFIAEYHAELNRRSAGRDREQQRLKAELARVERQIAEIIAAIKDGLRTASMREELEALEAKRTALKAAIETAPAPSPRLHPKLAELYRQKIADLHVALNAEETRAEAAEALRQLIEEIRLVPEESTLQIELRGDLAAILRLTSEHPRAVAAGVQVTLVAGARNPFCYNFWPGMAPAFRHEVENTHQLAA